MTTQPVSEASPIYANQPELEDDLDAVLTQSLEKFGVPNNSENISTNSNDNASQMNFPMPERLADNEKNNPSMEKDVLELLRNSLMDMVKRYKQNPISYRQFLQDTQNNRKNDIFFVRIPEEKGHKNVAIFSQKLEKNDENFWKNEEMINVVVDIIQFRNPDLSRGEIGLEMLQRALEQHLDHPLKNLSETFLQILDPAKLEGFPAELQKKAYGCLNSIKENINKLIQEGKAKKASSIDEIPEDELQQVFLPPISLEEQRNYLTKWGVPKTLHLQIEKIKDFETETHIAAVRALSLQDQLFENALSKLSFDRLQEVLRTPDHYPIIEEANGFMQLGLQCLPPANQKVFKQDVVDYLLNLSRQQEESKLLLPQATSSTLPIPHGKEEEDEFDSILDKCFEEFHLDPENKSNSESPNSESQGMIPTGNFSREIQTVLESISASQKVAEFPMPLDVPFKQASEEYLRNQMPSLEQIQMILEGKCSEEVMTSILRQKFIQEFENLAKLYEKGPEACRENVKCMRSCCKEIQQHFASSITSLEGQNLSPKEIMQQIHEFAAKDKTPLFPEEAKFSSPLLIKLQKQYLKAWGIPEDFYEKIAQIEDLEIEMYVALSQSINDQKLITEFRSNLERIDFKKLGESFAFLYQEEASENPLMSQLNIYRLLCQQCFSSEWQEKIKESMMTYLLQQVKPEK